MKTIHNVFVELLLIERICRSININAISVNIAQDGNTQQQFGTILELLAKYGINKYLSKYYKNCDCRIIDAGFKCIFSNDFAKESQDQLRVATLFNNNNSSTSSFELLLFSQSNDIITNIFQYLDLNSLTNCSLVNFVWLFHAFNDHSLYHLSLNKLIQYEQLLLGYNGKNKNKKCRNKSINLSIWQRLFNVKSISYDEQHFKLSNEFLTYFSMSFIHVKQFKCSLSGDYELTKQQLTLLQSIQLKNHKIEKFELSYHDKNSTIAKIQSSRQMRKSIVKAFPQLQNIRVADMSNAKSIEFTNIALPVMFSKECKSLCLSNVSINRQFYNGLINNCDLSGVEQLVLNNVYVDCISPFDERENSVSGCSSTTTSFSNNNNNNNNDDGRNNRLGLDLEFDEDKEKRKEKDKKEIIDTISRKMVNLQALVVIPTNLESDVISFWSSLQPIIKKNNSEHCFVVKIDDKNAKSTSLMLRQPVVHKNIQILYLQNDNNGSKFRIAKPFACGWHYFCQYMKDRLENGKIKFDQLKYIHCNFTFDKERCNNLHYFAKWIRYVTKAHFALAKSNDGKVNGLFWHIKINVRNFRSLCTTKVRQWYDGWINVIDEWFEVISGLIKSRMPVNFCLNVQDGSDTDADATHMTSAFERHEPLFWKEFGQFNENNSNDEIKNGKTGDDISKVCHYTKPVCNQLCKPSKEPLFCAEHLKKCGEMTFIAKTATET